MPICFHAFNGLLLCYKSWEVETVATWSAKPKIFPDTLEKIFANHCSRKYFFRWKNITHNATWFLSPSHPNTIRSTRQLQEVCDVSQSYSPGTGPHTISSIVSGSFVQNIDNWVPHLISPTLPLNKTHGRYMRMLKFEKQQAHLYSS